MNPIVVLTVAGSDSGGGAGAQADLKTIAALGGFGTTAITAVTAQNTAEVRAVHVLPAASVSAQIEAVLDDLPVAAVKTGLLASAEIVSTVVALHAARGLPNLVVDPVMVASTGDRLLDPDAVAAYRTGLLPAAAVVTPNLREAGMLLGADLRTLADARDAARAIALMGPRAVVVTGGHTAADGDAVDVLFDGASLTEYRRPLIATANTHGTGCSLASAVAVGLARGLDPAAAVAEAGDYVHAAIAAGARWTLGAGHGPLDHFPHEERIP